MNSQFLFIRRFLIAVTVICIPLALIVLLPSATAKQNPIRNVLLISIDTCRADYLSCYGHTLKTTPNIDQLAKQAIQFSHVVSPVPLTLPSHSTMLTGTSPPRHGVHDNMNYRLGASQETLAEMLAEQGFTTGAVVSAFVLDSQFGLDQGFDFYEDNIEENPDRKVNEFNERPASITTRLAAQWLNRHKDEKFFLFLHYFDPHVRYTPPEPFASKFPDDPYAGEIAYVDDCIGQVIRKLKDLGLYDSTLIIVTSDHGEMLGEHGEENHSYFIYQSAVRVPLIIRMPGCDNPKTIDHAVGIIDIVPTVCAMLHLQPPEKIEGHDLSDYFRENTVPTSNRHYYCESYTPTKYNANALLGIVNDRWKFIQTTRPELYDLADDPSESQNLIGSKSQEAQRLQKRLRQLIEDALQLAAADSKIDLDDQSRRRLQSLGYVAGKVTEGFDFDSSREDPKDLLDFYLANTQVNTLIGETKFVQAKKLCQEILTKRPDSYRTHLLLAQIMEAQGDNTGAVTQLQQALQIKPDSFEVHSLLSALLFRLGKLDEAIEHSRAALRSIPGALEVRNNLGTALAAKGQLKEAIVHLKQVAEAKPEMTATCINLAQALSDYGREQEAIAYLENCLKSQPQQFVFHNCLAQFHHRRKELAPSVFHYNESLRLNSHQPDILSRLATVHIEQGQIHQAIDCWNRALMLRPDWPVVLNNLAWVRAAHPNPQVRKPNRAIQLAAKACELTQHREPGLLDTLAVAYASDGQFEKAVHTARKAINLAGELEKRQLREQIEARLVLFRQQQPYLD
jgi:arylsulfatase A-like enzyme/Flp pilus assembly protein TadD